MATSSPERAAGLRRLGAAMDEYAWQAGEPCELHELAYCSSCKPSDEPPSVWITEGWSSAYHATRSCTALADGQNFVRRRGGEPAPLRQVPRGMALAMAKHPCLVCIRGKR